MNTSIVKVYNSSRGRWEGNARVVLEWSGFTNLGMSKSVYTNSNGIAEIQHSSTGQATVYVNGKAYEKMRTPGSKTIYI